LGIIIDASSVSGDVGAGVLARAVERSSAVFVRSRQELRP
jgi:hypothetical protein